MKKVVFIILICLLISAFFVGCGGQTVAQEEIPPMVAIGNPWSDWSSIEEAEAAVGFSFELPEKIAGSYTAVAFRTMNNELIEVIYRDADLEICVRKQKGEGQDISGDYNQYDTCTEESIDGGTVIRYYNSSNDAVKQLISYAGYSWSLVASNGYPEDSNWDLASIILEQ